MLARANRQSLNVEGSFQHVQLGYPGRTYYVCSEGCREAFQGRPDRYAGQGGPKITGTAATT